MSRRRLVARVTLLVLPLVVLAACSGGADDGAAPVEVLTRAGERTVNAGSARMALTVTMSTGGQELEISGEGSTDFETQAAEVTMDMGSLLGAFGVTGDDGTMEARTFENQVYIRAPILVQALGLPTPWVSMDLDRIAESELGADLGQLGSFANNDPRQTLAILDGSTEGAIEEVGEEEVRGAQTTHYRARVDLRRAYEQSGTIVDRDRFEQFLEQIGTEELDVDTWIDEDGLPRRIAYETPLPDTAEGGARLRMDLFDFGLDVDVPRPPEDEVTDLLDLVGG